MAFVTQGFNHPNGGREKDKKKRENVGEGQTLQKNSTKGAGVLSYKDFGKKLERDKARQKERAGAGWDRAHNTFCADRWNS